MSTGLDSLWPFVAVVSTVLTAVLTAYGSLILANRRNANTLEQRLLGATDDDTDDGFITNTEERLTQMEGDLQQHAAETHRTLYHLDERTQEILTEVRRMHSDDEPRNLPDDTPLYPPQSAPPPENCKPRYSPDSDDEE